MPKLLINEGGQASVFELFDDEATIGRGASNAIQVADDRSSKHHAVVRRVGGRVKIVDLESKNGTRVNGEFRNQRWLQHGDAISIGSAVLTYDGSDATAVAEEAVPEAAYAGVEPSYGGAAQASPVSRASSRSSSRSGSSRGGSAARSSRRGREEEGDEDDERPQRGARRKDNSTMIAAVIGIGLIGIVALMIAILGGKGNPPNTMALAHARDLSMRGGKENVQAALDYLTQWGDPRDADTYVSVAKEIELMKEKLKSFDDDDLRQAAFKEYKDIERAWIEMWKNGRTEASIGQDLIKWTDKYRGLPIVAAFESGNTDAKFLGVLKRAKAGGGAPK